MILAHYTKGSISTRNLADAYIKIFTGILISHTNAQNRPIQADVVTIGLFVQGYVMMVR